MVRCPDCQKEVDVDFGMTTCSSCGAVFMVEIDGSVQESLPAEEDNSVDESQNVHTSAGEEALEENQVD